MCSSTTVWNWTYSDIEPNVWNCEFKSSKLFYRVPHTYPQFSDQYFLCQRKLETYLNINSTYNSCTHVNSFCWMTTVWTSQGALRVSTNCGCTLSSTIPCILRWINFVFVTLSFFSIYYLLIKSERLILIHCSYFYAEKSAITISKIAFLR